MRTLIVAASLTLLACGQRGTVDSNPHGDGAWLARRAGTTARPPGAAVSQGGRIRRVGPDALTIQLPSKEPLQVRVDDRTQVRLDGQQVALQQLQPGQEVRVTYAPGRASPLARTVDASRQGQPASSAPQNIAPLKP